MGRNINFLMWQIKGWHMNLTWLAQTAEMEIASCLLQLCATLSQCQTVPGSAYPVPCSWVLHMKSSHQWNVSKTVNHLRARAFKRRWIKRWILWYVNYMEGRKRGREIRIINTYTHTNRPAGRGSDFSMWKHKTLKPWEAKAQDRRNQGLWITRGW